MIKIFLTAHEKYWGGRENLAKYMDFYKSRITKDNDRFLKSEIGREKQNECVSLTDATVLRY